MEELCFCGRQANRVHCPNCGSYHVRAFAARHDFVTRPDNTVVELKVYRCRGICGEVFNEDDWQLRCRATSATTVRPPKERAPLANAPDLSQNTPDRMMSILQDVLKKRGIK